MSVLAHDPSLLRAVFDESPIALLRCGVRDGVAGVIREANPAAAALLGHPVDALPGQALAALLPGLDLTVPACAPDGVGRWPYAQVVAGPAADPGAGTGDRWVAAAVSPLSAAAGPPDGDVVLVVLHDVTEHRLAELRLDREARCDPLTGLINRTELLRALAAVEPGTDGPLVAVVFLDLDGFKLVNDTRGHQVGDALLVAVARRIRAAIRPRDALARIGGDEFVAICPRLAAPAEARAIAERVRATLDQPVTVEGRAHRISMSVGIATAKAEAVDPADLLRQADMAMYRAKDAGRNTVRVHSAEMDAELVAAQRVREALLATLGPERRRLGGAPDATGSASQQDADGLVLHYQPIVEIASGRLAYVEALARLRLPDGSLLYPSQFLPVANRAGLTGTLSEEVLLRALAQRARWCDEGVDVPVGLNLAPGQVASASFAGDALRMIGEAGDEPRHVVFEMGEFGLLEATGPAQLTLRRLRASGIGLAIDHFGTGYSSLGALRFLGPHRVKIDRSFVASIPGSHADRAIVTAAVSAAHALGQRVVAEGVETAEQLAVLAELGCDEAQGFLIAQVLPAPQLGLRTARWAPGTLTRLDP
ncbi:MAG: sensor domain-containing phosphodiesterase [Candidatus Nanopelagicales bacterium]|nr:sensor domain-containing phosphodiesterase [Candidatus Nanopelagicales bacterium]